MNRRNFIKRGALFVPAIFVPRLIRAQADIADTAEGIAAFRRKVASGGGGGSPWSVIGTGIAAGSSNGGSSVTSGTYNTTGASLILLATSTFGSHPTPTDSKSNTWTLAKTVTASDSSQLSLWYCASPTTDAAQTFGVSGASTFPSVAALAFSGGAGGVTDQSNSAISSASSLQPGSITPTANAELIVSAFYFNVSATPTVNSSFSTPLESNHLNGECLGLCFAYLIQTTAVAVNPTWTLGSANPNAAYIVSLK